jgi:hypothetical protein
MKHIQCMGGVWRVSDRNFVRLAREQRETGGIADLDAYGTQIIDRLYDLDEVEYAALGADEAAA